MEREEIVRLTLAWIVPGSMVLVGGEPGIGKSTLLLQVAGKLEEMGHSTLYVSGEESALQVKLRAERLHGSAAVFLRRPRMWALILSGKLKKIFLKMIRAMPQRSRTTLEIMSGIARVWPRIFLSPTKSRLFQL